MSGGEISGADTTVDDADGSWRELLYSIVAEPNHGQLTRELSADVGPAPDGDEVIELWATDRSNPRLSLYEDLLREPRATWKALSAMPLIERHRMATFLIIEEWSPKAAIEWATRHKMHFLSKHELEFGDPDRAAETLARAEWPSRGALDYRNLVRLGADLGWTTEAIIELLLTGYPRCSAIPGLNEFVLEHAEAIKAGMAESPDPQTLHPFFRHCWELPETTIALFQAELLIVVASKGRRVQQRQDRESAERLLKRAGHDFG